MGGKTRVWVCRGNPQTWLFKWKPEQYFPTTLFTLYKAVPNLETVHEIVKSDTAFKIKSWAGSKERCCFISAVLYRVVFYKTMGFFFWFWLQELREFVTRSVLRVRRSSTSYPAKQSTSFSERARFVKTRKRLLYRIYRNDFCVGVQRAFRIIIRSHQVMLIHFWAITLGHLAVKRSLLSRVYCETTGRFHHHFENLRPAYFLSLTHSRSDEMKYQPEKQITALSKIELRVNLFPVKYNR